MSVENKIAEVYIISENKPLNHELNISNEIIEKLPGTKKHILPPALFIGEENVGYFIVYGGKYQARVHRKFADEIIKYNNISLKNFGSTMMTLEVN